MSWLAGMCITMIVSARHLLALSSGASGSRESLPTSRMLSAPSTVLAGRPPVIAENGSVRPMSPSRLVDVDPARRRPPSRPSSSSATPGHQRDPPPAGLGATLAGRAGAAGSARAAGPPGPPAPCRYGGRPRPPLGCAPGTEARPEIRLLGRRGATRHGGAPGWRRRRRTWSQTCNSGYGANARSRSANAVVARSRELGHSDRRVTLASGSDRAPPEVLDRAAQAVFGRDRRLVAEQGRGPASGRAGASRGRRPAG